MFIEWEEEVRVIDEVLEGCLIDEVWLERGLSSSNRERNRKEKRWQSQRNGGQMR